MAKKPKCELCGRELADAYKGTVCPMCRQEIESLKARPEKQSVAAPGDVTKEPNNQDFDVTRMVGIPIKTVWPAHQSPTADEPSTRTSAMPPGPKIRSKKTTHVVTSIILVFGFLLFLTVMIVLEEKVLPTVNRADSTSSSRKHISRSTARTAPFGETIKLVYPGDKPGTDGWKVGVPAFTDEKYYFAYYTTSTLSSLMEPGAKEQRIQELANQGHLVFLKSGLRVKVIMQSNRYSGPVLRILSMHLEMAHSKCLSLKGRTTDAGTGYTLTLSTQAYRLRGGLGRSGRWYQEFNPTFATDDLTPAPEPFPLQTASQTSSRLGGQVAQSNRADDPK